MIMKAELDTGVDASFETNNLTFYREREVRDIRRRQIKKQIDIKQVTNPAFFKKDLGAISQTFMNVREET